MTATNYRLSAELLAHDQDVRVLCALPSINDSGPAVVSGSRDKSVRLWRPQTNPFHYENYFTFEGHNHFISAVCYSHSTKECSEPRIYTGSNDNTIRCFNPLVPFPLNELNGHTDTITSLCLTADGHLVSASWDSTIRVWSRGKCIKVLQAHKFAVWAVLCLPNGMIVSAGADKLIKMWKDGECVKTISGHTDVVRGLCIVDGGFASCSNDGTVRIWSKNGASIAELNGHTSFVYDLCQLPNGKLASCGEDRCLRIWKDASCMQTIIHPCESVWCVAALDNGDVVTGSSDGVARVFTEAECRKAPVTVSEKFDREVKTQQINNQTFVGDMKKDSIPGPEALSVDGTREGQTKIIKQNSGKVECYQWSVMGGWQCMGEVVDAVGSSRKQTYNGKEYDYVFDVDISNDVPPLKLPYNGSQNPYEAAQDFIHMNELSQEYLDEIAEFIIKNTSGIAIGSESVGGAADPFTGSGGYRAGTGDMPSGTSGTADPFTGSGAYTTEQSSNVSAAPPSNYTGNGNADPFTTSKPFVKYFPQSTYVTFTMGNVAGAIKKISEFNKHEDIPPTCCLEVSEIENIHNMVKSPDVTCTVVLRKMLGWPEKYQFPVMDVLRLLVLTNGGAKIVAKERVFTSAVHILGKPVELAANTFMAARLLANSFERIESRGFCLEKIETLVGVIRPLLDHENRNIRLACVTIILNYGVAMTKNDTPKDTEAIRQCLTLLNQVLVAGKDPEIVLRALVSLGTFTSLDSNTKSIVIGLGLKATVKRCLAVHGHENEQIRNCVNFLLLDL
eukprot:CFRG6260T1